MKKLLGIVFLMCSSSAFGQYGELWFSAGQSLLSNRGLGTLSTIGGTKDDVKLDNGFRFGFRIAFNTDRWGSREGHEMQYAYSRTHLDLGSGTPQGMAIHTGGYNYLIYATEEGTRIRPFATGGVNFNNYVPPGSSATSGGGSTKFGFNYGGGVKARVMGMYALRFDVRQYTTPKPFSLPLASGWIKQLEVSAGVGIVF